MPFKLQQDGRNEQNKVIPALTGVTAGFWLLVFSGILLVLSFVVAWTASCLAAGAYHAISKLPISYPQHVLE